MEPENLEHTALSQAMNTGDAGHPVGDELVFSPPICCAAVAPVLSRVGDKWSMLIVMLLRDGPLRFNELKRRIGTISQRMLSLSLRGLERDGLVIRTVTPTVPPRVDYRLSSLGSSLAEPVQRLGSWARDNHETIAAAQRRFDASDRG